MSTPKLPPYLGSYEELVAALLHDPFLGSGRPRPRMLQSEGASPDLNPQPLPPGRSHQFTEENAAVRYLASVVNMKELGRTLGESPAGRQLSAQAETAFSEFLDDFCGTPPRRIPWHWPVPGPWVLALATEMVTVANTQSGVMREGMMQMAARIAEKGVGAGAQAKSAAA
jgi:hypothetical protein